MPVDEDGQQRLDAGQPYPDPPAGSGAEPPADSPGPARQHADTVAQTAELSPEELRRLRMRLTRKYH